MEDINALDEIHKGACMGMDALSYILEKVKDDKFKEELQKEYKDYKTIAERIEKIYPKYNEGEPHKTGVMTKAMTWSETQMKAMSDDSDSHMAELLLNGVNMGIIEGRRILNKKNLNDEVSKIVSLYVTMQEESTEKLKHYL